MVNQTICQAIREMRLLEFTYHGYRRVVEPHAHGEDAQGHDALRAYQAGGSSSSGDAQGWKIFHTDEMLGVSLSGQRFSSARPGYKRDDKAMNRIYCQL